MCVPSRRKCTSCCGALPTLSVARKTACNELHDTADRRSVPQIVVNGEPYLALQRLARPFDDAQTLVPIPEEVGQDGHTDTRPRGGCLHVETIAAQNDGTGLRLRVQPDLLSGAVETVVIS